VSEYPESGPKMADLAYFSVYFYLAVPLHVRRAVRVTFFIQLSIAQSVPARIIYTARHERTGRRKMAPRGVGQLKAVRVCDVIRSRPFNGDGQSSDEYHNADSTITVS